MEQEASGYGLPPDLASGMIPAPDLPYQPQMPKSYRPKIALIGCGGICEYHLRAYRTMGLDVVMLCDVLVEKARQRQQEFFPEARVTVDYHEVLNNPEIEVVDMTLYPVPRYDVMEAALLAGKHVLSQKPFVFDLSRGEHLCQLADKQGLRIAVNQNGRWAPHFSYMRNAIAAGLIGDVSYANFSVQWDHSWTADTPFNDIHHLLLYDFGIHWFDICDVFFGGQTALSVIARVTNLPVQRPRPPMLARVLIDYPHGQASVSFNGEVAYGQQDQTVVTGEHGTLRSTGKDLSQQTVALYTKDGMAVPELKGTWFEAGFQGAMGELLCAIEENRVPLNNARDNMRGLALCLAACASADEGGIAVVPGKVTRLAR